MRKSEIEKMARLEKTYWWFVGRRFLIQLLLSRYGYRLPSQSLILDIGCGSGGNLPLLSRWGKVVGLDPSPTALRWARQKKIGFLVLGDGHHLPFQDRSFDLVTLLDVLEHMDDDRRGLKEVWRVLKPQGILILTVPAFMSLWSGHDIALGHRRRYLLKPLSNLLQECGFQNRLIRYCIIGVFPAVYIFRKVQKYLGAGKEATTALIELPDFLNRLLIQILKVEALLLEVLKAPFGVSIVAVCQKIDPGS
ncbi:MAG: class I SAM-dependent methyltransferase [Armatimonadetes bacterium]|nr:class I SAM-dependent methyltransferase [Armatimonadota bacterium]MDW8121323.1 methyltransferase domain-containing protein [Armatimonadota bacterium]